ITHDLGVVARYADRVAVMYGGRVVETATARELYANPAHPYTRALLASMPALDPDHRTQVAPLAGDPPNPINPPSGCSFHPRCAMAEDVCTRRAPRLSDALAGHPVACLMANADGGHSRQMPAAAGPLVATL
ncbi:dipeptide ABC transporter ATP-binding protein, partial [Cupriavidus basilensis OR16]